MNISDRLKSKGAVKPQPLKAKTPLWKGPLEDGITFSLLSRFLVCRERFRIQVIEGLKSADHFNNKIEYGQMWHVCEEAHAAGVDFNSHLRNYSQQLCQRYPLDQEQILHWDMVCRTQFPLYVKHWTEQPDVKGRKPLLQEVSFRVPYKLPSGREVLLRGKWDSVDVIGKEGIYLQENKTKGDIDERALREQLTYDLQTMLYLTALHGYKAQLQNTKGQKIMGVRYNVVRRPLSGGKGSIRPHQATSKKPAETPQAFYERLRIIIESDPGYFFMRWKVEVTRADVEKFQRECLDPVLEQLCDWWEYITSPAFLADSLWTGKTARKVNPIHWRHPYGVYNPLNEGRYGEVDEYLKSGSELGLQRATTLFPELE